MTRKSLLLAQVTVAIGLVLDGGVVIGQPSSVQTERLSFFCKTDNGVPTTIVRIWRENSQEEFPIIFWRSRYFNNSGWNPERRCQEVSQRLERYYRDGSLKDIVPGVLNGQPVVCVARSRNGLCSGLLFTVENNTDANRVVEEFRNILPLQPSRPRPANPRPAGDL